MAINTDIHESANGEHHSKGQEIKSLQALWVLFSSMKTAIFLLLLLATLSVLGTVISQNALPEEYLRIYGPFKYKVFHALGLTNVYHSTWYRLLIFLMGVNLTVCSLNRFKLIWNQTVHPKIAMPSSSISKMQRTDSIASRDTIKDTANKIITALRGGSYRVAREDDGEDVAIYAAKGAFSLWGPYLTHLSILVIFIGAVIGSMLGFEGYTTISEGQSTSTYERAGAHQQMNLGFRVLLNDFRITHDKDRNPTGYKSDLRIYEGNKQVAQKIIDVNHPLTYRGISFHQSDYGLVGYVLKVTDPNGQVVRVPFDMETGSGPYGKEFIVSGDPFKQINIGGKKLTIFAHDFIPDFTENSEMGRSSLPLNPAANIMVNDRFPEYKGLDGWSKLGWLALSKSAKYKGYTITMEDAMSYSGLQVSKNPGLPVIYAGFLLLLGGVFLSFYINRMVVRIRISPASQGSKVLLGAVCRLDAGAFDRDFARLQSAIK